MTLSRPMIPESEGALELLPVVFVFFADELPPEVLPVADEPLWAFGAT
ncbi:MAG: hypothetical protein ACRENK_13665 [Gemmatimonadaceae bacterium]